MSKSGKYDNKPLSEKRLEAGKVKKKKQIPTWDDLAKEQRTCLELISKPHLMLEQLAVDNAEVVNGNEKLVKMRDGLDQTFRDLINKTLEVSRQHANIVEKDDKLVFEFEKGKVDINDVDQMMKWHKIHNEYGALVSSVAQVGIETLAQFASTIGEVLGAEKGILDQFNSETGPAIKAFKDMYNGTTLKDDYTKAIPQSNKDNDKDIMEDINTIKEGFSKTIDNLSEEEIKKSCVAINKEGEDGK